MTDQVNEKQDDFYELLREYVEERISERKPSDVFTLEDIVVDEVWDQLSISQRQNAGRYVSKLAKKNLLPLICVGKINGNTKLYKSK
jgi:hypothetical protein